MKVQNMTSAKGNDIANQFIITSDDRTSTFQSYDSVIAVIRPNGEIELDEYYWDFSVTTGKYRNQFLNENKAETIRKIDSGLYKLVNLN
jgi:hypothetical protein